MTAESGIPNPESDVDGVPDDWVRFGTVFACCPNARAHLLLSWPVIFGTVSFLTLSFDHIIWIDLRTDGWLRIFCICSYVLALIIGVVGLLSILIGGIRDCGRVRLGGRKLRNSSVGLLFLGVFTLPWLTLIALSWSKRFL
jgi:hypothetical protein